MGTKPAGVIITTGLLLSGGMWAGTTFLTKSRTDKQEKQAKIAFGVMATFLALFFVKVFLAPNIGDIAEETVAERVAGAARAVKEATKKHRGLSNLADSAAAGVEMKTRIFFGTTPMEMVYALTTAVGMGLLYTKRKKKDQTDGDKAAAFFLILLLMFMVGVQAMKDSVPTAIREAQQAADKVRTQSLAASNNATAKAKKTGGAAK